jgi:hypothetical protein
MLLFGHTGITLGSAVLLTGILNSYRLHKVRSKGEKNHAENSSRTTLAASRKGERNSWLSSLGRRMDLRLLLVGALLPDIIDKPVGQYLFRETLGSGRIFCHTLLFLLLISMSGWYLYRRRRQVWLLILAFGTFMHVTLDRMWEIPRNFLWPLYGLTFQEAELTGWLSNIFRLLFRNPEIYVPELMGAVILIWFAGTLLYRRKVFAFIRYGQVD